MTRTDPDPRAFIGTSIAPGTERPEMDTTVKGEKVIRLNSPQFYNTQNCNMKGISSQKSNGLSSPPNLGTKLQTSPLSQ